MGKYRFKVSERVAVWRGHGQRCFYTDEPLAFRDLNIDHVIPESILKTPPKLKSLLEEIGESSNFDVNSFNNWVPANHSINRRKSDLLENPRKIMHYLTVIESRLARVNQEYEKFKKTENIEKVILKALALVESNELSPVELISHLRPYVIADQTIVSEPIVFTTELYISEIATSERILEAERLLLAYLEANSQGIYCITEPSKLEENKVQIKIAAWHVSESTIVKLISPKGEFTEFGYYSDFYESKSDELYAQAAIKNYEKAISDPSDEHFGLRHCPKCASTKLSRASACDYEHDEVYYTIECNDCGFSDWTQ